MDGAVSRGQGGFRFWSLAEGNGRGPEVPSLGLRPAWAVPASGSAEGGAGSLTPPLPQSPAPLAAVPFFPP